MNRRPIPFRGIRKLPVWLFAVALVLQMAMPFSQVLANAQADGSGTAVEICTGSAIAIVYLDVDGNATGQPRPASPPVACEYCHLCPGSGLQGALLVSQPLLLAGLVWHPVVAPVVGVPSPRLPGLVSQHQTRGPPVLI